MKLKAGFFVFYIFAVWVNITYAQTPDYQLPAIDHPGATYEKDILPFIMEQINHTAASFFYDTNEMNMHFVNMGLPTMDIQTKNAIVGDNETGGTCGDYALHFVENYKGLGRVYYIHTDVNGVTCISGRIKPFEKSDLIITDDKGNNSEARNRQKEVYRDLLYAQFIQMGNDYKGSWGFGAPDGYHDNANGWNIAPISLSSTKEGNVFVMESKYVPTPESHTGISITKGLGKTYYTGQTPFIHTWVRIIWRDMTIDVDPTFYDAGSSLEVCIMFK